VLRERPDIQASGLIFVLDMFSMGGLCAKSPPDPIMPNLSYIRTEIERMRFQVSRQRKEMPQLQRSGYLRPPELLLVRMHAKVEQLRSDREHRWQVHIVDADGRMFHPEQF
jgi:hypothetical protein